MQQSTVMESWSKWGKTPTEDSRGVAVADDRLELKPKEETAAINGIVEKSKHLFFEDTTSFFIERKYPIEMVLLLLEAW